VLANYATETNTHFLSALLAPTWAKCSPSVALMASLVIFGNLLRCQHPH